MTISERTRRSCPYIVFVDEAGFMLGPLVRKTWAPRGCTPIIKVTKPHERISAIGAMTISPKRNHFAFHFLLSKDNANFHGDSVVGFVETVRRKIRGSIALIWDEIAIHHSTPMYEYLAAHRSIVVHPFPPYAPELNPVDRIWGYVKYNRMANYCSFNLKELRKRVTAEFRKVQKKPDLLESLFRSTGLTLD
jgi:putative transposase